MSSGTLTTGSVRLGRLSVNHTYGGHGEPALLLIHGLGSSGYLEWRHNLPALARSRAVFAPDLPGFGRSDKPALRYDVPFFAQTLERYMAEMGLKRPVILGASLGGRIAAELVVRHPRRAAKLVLVDSLGLGAPNLRFYYPLMMLPGVGESLLRGVRTLLGALPNHVLRNAAGRLTPGDTESAFDDSYFEVMREMHREDAFHDAYLSTVRSLARRHTMNGGPDLVGALAGARLPVQLIWGSRDPLFPVAHALEAHRRLPRSRLAVLEGAGHSPQAERPDDFNRIVEDFVRS